MGGLVAWLLWLLCSLSKEMCTALLLQGKIWGWSLIIRKSGNCMRGCFLMNSRLIACAPIATWDLLAYIYTSTGQCPLHPFSYPSERVECDQQAEESGVYIYIYINRLLRVEWKQGGQAVEGGVWTTGCREWSGCRARGSVNNGL